MGCELWGQECMLLLAAAALLRGGALAAQLHRGRGSASPGRSAGRRREMKRSLARCSAERWLSSRDVAVQHAAPQPAAGLHSTSMTVEVVYIFCQKQCLKEMSIPKSTAGCRL